MCENASELKYVLQFLAFVLRFNDEKKLMLVFQRKVEDA